MKRTNRARRLTNRGDTIVEVMIVLAVLGMAIAICYATANRSLTDARQAQENSEASQIAISQIEQLRANAGPAALPANSPYTLSNQFCYMGGSRDSNLSHCVNGLYRFRIERVSVVDKDFRVVVQWDNVRGDGQDEVTMRYRLP